jgi:hypothetical protein
MPNMGGPQPDLAAAAKKLGITETELKDAFNNKLPPDFPTAAKTLGITETELKAALDKVVEGPLKESSQAWYDEFQFSVLHQTAIGYGSYQMGIDLLEKIR